MRRFLEGLIVVVVVGSIAVLAILSRNGGIPPSANSLASASPQIEAGAAPSRAPGPQTPSGLAPVAPPEELPGECANHVTSTDGALQTVETMSINSSVVALGTIAEVGAAAWNTADGALPDDENERAASAVIRLVKVRLDRNVFGPALDAVTIWIEGGTIGCHQFITDRSPFVIAVGDRFALFLDGTAPDNGTKGVLRARAMWRVSKDDMVDTAADGKLTVDAFERLVAIPTP